MVLTRNLWQAYQQTKAESTVNTPSLRDVFGATTAAHPNKYES